MNNQEIQLNKIKDIVNDGILTINERDYKITGTTHERRLKVFAFFSEIQNNLGAGNFSFLADMRYKEIEKIFSDMVLFNNGILSKELAHWDNYGDDYLIFITNMFMVVSYPFLKGSLTNSISK